MIFVFNDDPNDDSALTQFFRSESDSLYRYALHVAKGNEALAKEALSESFVRVIARYDHLRSFSEGRLVGYMLTIIKHVIFDSTKKEKKIVYLDTVDTLPDDDVDFLEKTIQSADEEIIKKCVERLSVHDRALIKLRYYDNASDDAIASALNISPASVRSELSRAHRRLKNLYIELEKR